MHSFFAWPRHKTHPQSRAHERDARRSHNTAKRNTLQSAGASHRTRRSGRIAARGCSWRGAEWSRSAGIGTAVLHRTHRRKTNCVFRIRVGSASARVVCSICAGGAHMNMRRPFLFFGKRDYHCCSLIMHIFISICVYLPLRANIARETTAQQLPFILNQSPHLRIRAINVITVVGLNSPPLS